MVKKIQNGKHICKTPKTKEFPDAKVSDLPDLTHRTYMDLNKARSADSIECKDMSHYEKLMDRYLAEVPRFRLDISYDTLVDRSLEKSNKPKDVEAANLQIADMESWPSDPFTAIFQAKDGEALLCVFAYKAPQETAKKHVAKLPQGADYGPFYKNYLTGPKGHPGRTCANLTYPSSELAIDSAIPSSSSQASSDPGSTVQEPSPSFHYGFTARDCEILYEAAQRLHSVLTPHTHERDICHAEDPKVFMTYTKGLINDEGHTNHQIVPSADILG
ncbi:hypothetical protein EYR38_002419 [Pleurotus pulmonarius]|nr:hypothetical protein EYR38_002419 [Pleurotus pulmonarius]